MTTEPEPTTPKEEGRAPSDDVSEATDTSTTQETVPDWLSQGAAVEQAEEPKKEDTPESSSEEPPVSPEPLAEAPLKEETMEPKETTPDPIPVTDPQPSSDG